jgi:hypothetical protein
MVQSSFNLPAALAACPAMIGSAIDEPINNPSVML